MKGIIKYRILPDYQLVIESFIGLITLDQLITVTRNQLADPRYNPSYNYLSDMRLGTNGMTENDLLEFVSLIQESKFVAQRKSAYLVDNHDQEITTTIYNILKKGTSIDGKVVKSLDQAFDWIAIPAADRPKIDAEMRKLSA